MKNLLFTSLLLSFILISCDGTFVTKNVIDSRMYEFIHANKKEKILFELKEIRTTTRRNGFFKPGPMSKNVSFDYAIYASVSDGRSLVEIYEFPCQKDIDFDEFINEIKLKRSKKRDHFALAYKNETIGVFHVINKVSFLADYPLNPKGFQYGNFKNLDLNNYHSARQDLLNHINGSNPLVISDKELRDILVSLPPQDELNHELSFAISKSDIFQNLTYQKEVIDHCKKDIYWKKNALSSIKNRKTDLTNHQFIAKLHAIGGMEEVVKEDEYQYKLFKSGGNFSYFVDRLDNNDILFSKRIKEQVIIDVKYLLQHPCNFSSDQIRTVDQLFNFAEKLRINEPFALFFKSYKDSKCISNTLEDFNSEFLFGTPILGESDKRVWVDFVVKNFNKLQKNERSWAYRRIEEHITCEQKRELLVKYKSDIDTFDDMEIPECR